MSASPPPSTGAEPPHGPRRGAAPRLPEEPAAWLAECAAYDSAGADALWLDGGPDPAHDVLALAAALAAATGRARLVVALPDSVPQAALLARALATVVLLSGGRLALAADSRRCAELGAVAPTVPAFRRLAPAGPGYEEPGAGRWTPAAAPAGPDAWRTALAGCRGARGARSRRTGRTAPVGGAAPQRECRTSHAPQPPHACARHHGASDYVWILVILL